jgi:circadian clock protein KaiB
MKTGKPAKKCAPARPAKRKKYSMRLYVTGATPRSTRAITNLKKLCDEYLPGQYDLEVIDMYQQPNLARAGKIVAVPTLVKSFPLPLRRFIGDMSNKEVLLTGLEIRATADGPASKGLGKE